ncbi:hypothetical protein [Chryseobacterium gwangjuense]|uniref:hypothetical protein n=1 Tax=Chryseobacterium gwangjuense TaxID=1069980 RepID=UPI001E32025F|nr:hypothetical protein [Chryseobacterium gwangjuense]MCE3076184.1 hypothetical protein [Chryseobacterium gwangjuense]
MKTYQFRFNNSNKTSVILIWFFTTLLTITLTGTILVILSNPYFPTWLLLISFPLLFLAIYKLYKTTSERQSTDTVTLNKEGFISSCFGSVLFSDISVINIPARNISLLGGKNYDYYKQTDIDMPHLVISITTDDNKIFRWVLGEWDNLYNSKEDFSVVFDFLTTLTDQLYQYYHANEPTNSYLKILDENGLWEKKVS